MIECPAISGKTVQLPKEKFVFRPTVYGIILNKDKILIIKTEKDRIILPSGAVEIGETTKEALQREVMEEVRIIIKIKNLFSIKEYFLYEDNKDIGYQKICFYYKCEAKNLQLIKNDEEKIFTEWLDLKKAKDNYDKMGNITKEIFNKILL